MSVRNRRRRFNLDSEDENAIKEFQRYSVMFAEENAYKMEK